MNSFGQLWKMLIRPNRQEYSQQDLGYEIQIFKKYKACRSDFVVLNKKNLKLQCSLFEPISLTQPDKYASEKFPCVIYCHCNSGSRMEALKLLPDIIDRGVGLFCFDFSGSGLSEGEYVTLGYNESSDLECVIDHLYESGKISNIGLWGRSMGAATSILYAGKKVQQKPLKGIVFDSGFSNLNFLQLDIAKQKTGMPGVFIEPVLSLVNDQVNERISAKIQDIDLAKTIYGVYVPIYFVCSKEDTLVKCEHSEQLHARYNGQKWLMYVSGNHNANRSPQTLDVLANWITNLLFERDQDPTEPPKQKPASFPRKNTMTAVSKIDLIIGDSPQQVRKSSLQTTSGQNMLPTSRISPRFQIFTSIQASPSTRLDTQAGRSISPISQNSFSSATNSIPQSSSSQQSFQATQQSLQNFQQQQQVLNTQQGPPIKHSLINLQEKLNDQYPPKQIPLPPQINYSPQTDPQYKQSLPDAKQYVNQSPQIRYQVPQSRQQPNYQSPTTNSQDQKSYSNSPQVVQQLFKQSQQQKQATQQNQQPPQLAQQQNIYQPNNYLVQKTPSASINLQNIDFYSKGETTRLSLKEQQYAATKNPQLQTQLENTGSMSRVPTEENSNFSGNQGTGGRGSSTHHGYSFLSNPNEDISSNDRSSLTPSRCTPLIPTVNNGSSSKIKGEESPNNNVNKVRSSSNVNNRANNALPDPEDGTLKKQNDKFQDLPSLVVKKQSTGTNEQGFDTPSFCHDRKQPLAFAFEESGSPSCNVAQEIPIESVPQFLPSYSGKNRNPSHFSTNQYQRNENSNFLISPSSPQGADNLFQQLPLTYQNNFMTNQSPKDSSSQQQGQQVPNSQRSIRSSTCNAIPSTSYSSNNTTPTSNSNNFNLLRQPRQIDPKKIEDNISPKAIASQLAQDEKPQQTQQGGDNFLQLHPTFFSSYSYPVQPQKEIPVSVTNSNAGYQRARLQNNSLDLTNHNFIPQQASISQSKYAQLNIQNEGINYSSNQQAHHTANQVSQSSNQAPYSTNQVPHSSSQVPHQNLGRPPLPNYDSSHGINQTPKNINTQFSGKNPYPQANTTSNESSSQQAQEKKIQVKTVGISIFTTQKSPQSVSSQQQQYDQTQSNNQKPIDTQATSLYSCQTYKVGDSSSAQQSMAPLYPKQQQQQQPVSQFSFGPSKHFSTFDGVTEYSNYLEPQEQRNSLNYQDKNFQNKIAFSTQVTSGQSNNPLNAIFSSPQPQPLKTQGPQDGKESLHQQGKSNITFPSFNSYQQSTPYTPNYQGFNTSQNQQNNSNSFISPSNQNGTNKYEYTPISGNYQQGKNSVPNTTTNSNKNAYNLNSYNNQSSSFLGQK